MSKIQFVKVLRKNLQSPTDPEKTYAVAQSRSTVEITDLAKHMAAHQSPFTAGTIQAVITDMVSCMRELLLDGYAIHLGDLGNFYVHLKSEGVLESVVDRETGQKPVFSAANIKAVNTVFTAGSGFQDLINDASFTEVSSLRAQQRALNDKKAQLADGTWDPKADTGDTTDEDHD